MAASYLVTGERARQMRVVPAAVLKRLYMRSNKAGAIQTLAHLYLLVAGSVLIFETMDSWWIVPALLLQAVFIHSLFGALAEAGHYGPVRPRRVPRVPALLSGGGVPKQPGLSRPP